MTNKQLVFNLFVGALLVALGAVLATQASTGIGLLGVGVAIIGLTLFTRYGQYLEPVIETLRGMRSPQGSAKLLNEAG